MSDYSSSMTVTGRGNIFLSNQASFGAVFAGKGFVDLGQDTVVRNNLASTPADVLASSSINFNKDIIGFGGVYWYSGNKPPTKMIDEIDDCRLFC